MLFANFKDNYGQFEARCDIKMLKNSVAWKDLMFQYTRLQSLFVYVTLRQWCKCFQVGLYMDPCQTLYRNLSNTQYPTPTCFFIPVPALLTIGFAQILHCWAHTIEIQKKKDLLIFNSVKLTILSQIAKIVAMYSIIRRVS